MAEDLFSKSLQKLEDELTCPLCKQHFTQPKILPCLHYYCKTCIADLIKSADGRPFNCPKCRREAQTAGKDPECFLTPLFVNRMEEVFSIMKKAELKENTQCESCSHFAAVDFCHDCSHYICTKCSEAHKQMLVLSSHKVVSINSLCSTIIKDMPEKIQMVGREVKCSKHKNEPLKLYCHDCHNLVCCDCIVIDHKDHRYALVVDAAPLCKAEIKEKAESVRKVSDSLKAAVKSLEDSKKKLSDQEAATTKAIDDALDEVVAIVSQKRRELKAKASDMVSGAKEKVSEQEKNAELAVGEVESLLEFMNRSLETATDQELLSLEKQISDQVDRVSSLYNNPAGKFAVPELPLVVQCGPGVKHAIKREISVVKDGSPIVQRKRRSIAVRYKANEHKHCIINAHEQELQPEPSSEELPLQEKEPGLRCSLPKMGSERKRSSSEEEPSLQEEEPGLRCSLPKMGSQRKRSSSENHTLLQNSQLQEKRTQALRKAAMLRNQTTKFHTHPGQRLSAVQEEMKAGAGSETEREEIVEDAKSLILAVPGNRTCADCSRSYVNWASVNLGLVVCHECSAVHRSLGEDVSKIKSLFLDQWDRHTVNFMLQWGNTKANNYYEAILGTGQHSEVRKPTTNTSRTERSEFIQQKYVALAFTGLNFSTEGTSS